VAWDWLQLVEGGGGESEETVLVGVDVGQCDGHVEFVSVARPSVRGGHGGQGSDCPAPGIRKSRRQDIPPKHIDLPEVLHRTRRLHKPISKMSELGIFEAIGV